MTNDLKSLNGIKVYNYDHMDPPDSATRDPILRRWVRKATTCDGWLGTHNYSALCLPRLPWVSRSKNSHFYGPNDDIPILLAIVMGIQHFLVVVCGTVTPALIVSGSGANNLNFDENTRQYMVSASLLCSGLMTLVQIIHFRIPKTNYYIGAGLLQVAGTSFANIAAAQAVIKGMYANGSCEMLTAADGSIEYLPCFAGYGAILGTQMLSSVMGLIITFLPKKTVGKLFPKLISGIMLTVIAGSLLYDGLSNWNGGTGPCRDRPSTGLFSLCPTLDAPHAQTWGSAINWALGASVFFTILVVELVGSVFMRNVSVILGLAVGCGIAGGLGMVDGSGISTAPVITFLWVKTFPISVYAPAIIPYLLVQTILAIECIGDLTAASKVSGLPVDGDAYETRVQGGILADTIGTIFSACSGAMAVVTFTENNGVIASSSCASRAAGVVCAIAFLICGIFGKVVGALTTYMYGQILASGLSILAYLKFDRRERVISAVSLSVALGVAMVPNWFTYVLPTSSNPVVQGILSTIETICTTPFIIAAVLSIALNLTMPVDLSGDAMGICDTPMGNSYRMYHTSPA
ncbi:permease family-domain-containing protein [Gongronella butleri]|nr:permease family-domain-containing protein [Gongronella butleri]